MEALIAFAAQYWLHSTGVTVVGAVLAGWKFRQWWVARRIAFLDDIKKAVREEPRTKEAQNGVAKDMETVKATLEEHGRHITDIREGMAEIRGYIRGQKDAHEE